MLQVIGAGFPRTGTTSLRAAVERLLGGQCYHMHELFARLEHVPGWQRALAGETEALDDVLRDYVGAIDWPASVFWRDLADRHPDALIVLSTRSDAETWWRSFDATVARAGRAEGPAMDPEWQRLFFGMLEQEIGPVWDHADRATAAYERHCAQVRADAPPERLLEWSADQGWEPLCAALGVPVPDEPFPHLNTSEEWGRRSPEPE